LTQPSCGLAEVAQNAPANWGLDRIDQHSLPLDNSYTTRCDGSRVQVYVLDTGIRKSHVEFNGRAICGANYVSGESCQDFDGHGTHVAGTIGGATYGVAKRVEILDVKVFNREGVGALSTVLAGLEYVVSQKRRNPDIPMVVNMSLGSVGTSNEIKNAVDEAVAAGIVVVVAAGNKGMDACNYSPAFVPSAITVGATDRQDARPTWSNFGNCVDLSAPGVQIVSAYFTNDRATASLSGTSMAAPHVAGAAALYLQANPSWTPAQVWQAMRNDASDSVQGTARRMLQTQFI
jgi:subtilisin family serine protease